jgi:hypothetical protein
LLRKFSEPKSQCECAVNASRTEAGPDIGLRDEFRQKPANRACPPI